MSNNHADDYTFVFDTYDVTGDTLSFTYHYEDSQASNLGAFTERYILPPDVTIDEQDPTTAYILQITHLIVGVSYYKSLRGGVRTPRPLSHSEADYLNTIYQEGLGEYAYVNRLPHPIQPFVAADNTAARPPINLQHSGALVGVGGGKDSAVALELLRQCDISLSTLDIATRDHHGQAVAVMDEAGFPQVRLQRYVDTSITSFTNQHHGCNGHIPLSTIFAWIGLLIAHTQGKQYVVMANEAASSEGNVLWNDKTVNHQWAKSFEAEKLTQQFVHTHVSPDLWYFSPIRSYGSIRIMQLFAKLCRRYYDIFTSCNFVLRIDPTKRPQGKWCASCAKCLSTWLLLSTSLDVDALVDIFGRNLFDDASLRPELEALLGIEGHKPLDCVGTTAELRAATRRALASEQAHSPLLSGITADAIPGPDLQKLADKHSENAIPAALAKQIESAAEQVSTQF